jgi:uncharacterized protein (DUF1684 family)
MQARDNRRRKTSRRLSVVGLRRGLAVVMILPALIAMARAVEPPDAAYVKDFEKWKAEEIDDLKQNWLPLAGLFWLKPGDNVFGSASENPIVLPSGPAKAGRFIRNGDDITVEFEPGVQAKIEGKVVKTAKLQADITGKAEEIELGSLRVHVIKRGERLGIRVKDLDSAAAKNYAGPRFFPLDMTYRVIGSFVPSDGKRTVDVPNVLGDVTPVPITGEVHFKLNGQDLTLTALGGDPAKGLSFVIGDLTGKTDTYPGGRFLDSDAVVNGKVVIDFNRAYNPPCAVTPYATCPLAPKENRLPVAVMAGEKYDRKHGSH